METDSRWNERNLRCLRGCHVPRDIITKLFRLQWIITSCCMKGEPLQTTAVFDVIMSPPSPFRWGREKIGKVKKGWMLPINNISRLAACLTNSRLDFKHKFTFLHSLAFRDDSQAFPKMYTPKKRKFIAQATVKILAGWKQLVVQDFTTLYERTSGTSSWSSFSVRLLFY